MQLTFTEEQEMLKQSAKKFFKNQWSIEQARNYHHNPPFWQQLTQAGWLSLLIPQNEGGAGGTLLDMGIVLEQAGYALCTPLFYSTVHAIVLCKALRAHSYLQQIANGKSATVAFEEAQAHNDATYFSTYAQYKDCWLLNGQKIFVPQVAEADLLFVCAKTANGFGVFAVNKGDTMLTAQQTIGCNGLTVVNLSNVKATCLANDITAEQLHHIRLQMTALQSVEMVGGMCSVIDQTVHYVSMRKQFNVAIGSFQAVQHHLANMYTGYRGARLLAYKALFLFDKDDVEAIKATHLAKAYASEVYQYITMMAHQLWGGIGYSTESTLYLWSNRATATGLSYGTAMVHKQALGKILKEQVQAVQTI